MKWFSIRDSKTGNCVGVLLESETGGIAAAALAGEFEDSDSCLRIVSTIMKSGKLVFVARDGLQIVSRSVSSGDPGYAKAVACAVQPPLMPGEYGEVKKVGSPADMVNRIWTALGADGPPPPIGGSGGDQTRRVDTRLKELYPAR